MNFLLNDFFDVDRFLYFFDDLFGNFYLFNNFNNLFLDHLFFYDSFAVLNRFFCLFSLGKFDVFPIKFPADVFIFNHHKKVRLKSFVNDIRELSVIEPTLVSAIKNSE